MMKKTALYLSALMLAGGVASAALVTHFTFDGDTIASPIDDTVINNSGSAVNGSLREWNDINASASFSSSVAPAFSSGQSISFSNTAGSGGGVLVSGNDSSTGVTTATRTFAAWINTNSSNDQVIANWGAASTGASTGAKYTIRLDSMRLRLEVQGGAIIGTTTLNTNEWVHLAVVQNANSLNNVTFYINGQQDTLSQTATTTIATSSSSLRIGGEVTSGNNAQRYYSGLMDDVRLYNTALTSTEISALAIPEPGTLALLGIAGVALAVTARRRK